MTRAPVRYPYCRRWEEKATHSGFGRFRRNMKCYVVVRDSMTGEVIPYDLTYYHSKKDKILFGPTSNIEEAKAFAINQRAVDARIKEREICLQEQENQIQSRSRI